MQGEFSWQKHNVQAKCVDLLLDVWAKCCFGHMLHISGGNRYDTPQRHTHIILQFKSLTQSYYVFISFSNSILWEQQPGIV